MRARPQILTRFISLGAALVLVAGCSDSGPEPPAASAVFDLVIAERRVELEDETIRVVRGQTVTLRFSTDEAAEIHLHGYDVVAKLVPGTPDTLTFKAEATGRFPITAHHFGPAPGAGHEHTDHAHDAGASEQEEEKTLLYVEVHPR